MYIVNYGRLGVNRKAGSGDPKRVKGKARQRTTARDNVCRFWECEKPVRRKDHFLCYDHYKEHQEEKVDECQGCGRFKHAKYDQCLDCRNRQPPQSRSQAIRESRSSYQREHSEAWEARDADAKEFFVYILKLQGGSFYAGQTRELRERLMEHRDGTTKSTAGKDPKLVWFSTVSTRDQATALEVELKRLCDENPREIRRWVVGFNDLVKELDFT